MGLSETTYDVSSVSGLSTPPSSKPGSPPLGQPWCSTSTSLTNRSTYLGSTIEEKTRSLLGWSSSIPCQTRVPGPDRVRKTKSAPGCLPYSIGGAKSHLTPPESPSHRIHSTCSSPPISPVSTGSAANEAFEKLRNIVPRLGPEQSRYRVLVQIVTNVIEQEARLAELKKETQAMRDILAAQEACSSQQSQQHPSPPQISPSNVSDTFSEICCVPDDLAHVDISAFANLMSPVGACDPWASSPVDSWGLVDSSTVEAL